ncbi:type I restriction endonuclease subunit R [uncultured Rhodoblastus sp.]|uniref:EcoAI/FtnUII family type I restriction enzme subunit R n=1 Tax=uncultured Rhodoblastus sp. TaxID=543037 RepID=UPI0025CF1FD6|nr:type I restriction endonuclease subunit R [uncultured Rhodoblastus sp.]
MNEAETRAELIDPALTAAGWGVIEGSRTRREMIAPGRIQGGGRRADALKCDYVLTYRNQKLAVIEAKRCGLADTEGVGQAKDYAGRLLTRFAYSTNGVGIYQIDMKTGAEGYVSAYPSPDDLWNRVFAEANVWRDRFNAIPFVEKGGGWSIRYYQANAVNKALEALAAGKTRILLTLATGTGKTTIAFQIAWKLFEARWNLSGEPTRRPRILFLADRNILANQAYNDFSSFAAFAEDGMIRIKPDEIAKRGRVPKNGNLFFTIFQTFSSGRDAEGRPAPSFGDYPSDFFDFIIIDECHRGGANDEGDWRKILEYFAPAVQLGLTATPKRKNNVDTYAYFGEPVYTYSLKEGINDGFLTPFKVKQIATTLDDYVYTPDDTVVEGEIDQARRYTEADFNRVIIIEAREQYRVKLLMSLIDQREKTLVFCATQLHALAVRNLINQMKASTDPHYCERVTSDDGKLGEQSLLAFQDNEKTIPTILTTSQKLSTGVDARNIRNIVLMRPVTSMIEFKQIIGRGTRLFDGKDHFTIYDFVKAYELFNDPEWDGEPQDPPEPATPRPPRPDGEGEGEGGGEGDEDEEAARPKTIKIKLADGKERTIQHMMATTFWSPDGRPMSAAEFVQRLFGELPQLFKDEDELRKIWSAPETRKALLDQLSEKGFSGEQLDAMRKLIDAEKSDLFDVLAYIAYELPPITREDRVEGRRAIILAPYDAKLQTFLSFVLARYIRDGDGELSFEKLGGLLELKYHSVNDATVELGSVASIRDAFNGFQRYLYDAPS